MKTFTQLRNKLEQVEKIHSEWRSALEDKSISWEEFRKIDRRWIANRTAFIQMCKKNIREHASVNNWEEGTDENYISQVESWAEDIPSLWMDEMDKNWKYQFPA